MKYLIKIILVWLGLSRKYETADIKYAKYIGVKFKDNLRITGSVHFSSEPYLIELGNNVTLTPDVKFLTHDGGVGLFRKEFPGINVFGKIIVGNNVFIGANSILLLGVKVGDNVVIGAGSIVTKDIPSNSVVAGNPARVIRQIDEYKNKSLEKAVFITEKKIKLRRKLILKYFD